MFVHSYYGLHCSWGEGGSANFMCRLKPSTSIRSRSRSTVAAMMPEPMGVFRGPPPNRPKNCRSTTTKDRLAALLLLQCQAYWIRKPDDSTSFSSVNELKEIAEVVVLIDISATFLSCVLCVQIATGLAKKPTHPILHIQLCQLTDLFSKLFQCRILRKICNKVIVNFSHISHLTSIMSFTKLHA